MTTPSPPTDADGALDVVIVTHNGRELVRACLDSLVAETAHVPLRILVVDNGSSDGTPQLVRLQYPVELIHAGSNLGFGRAANIGLRRARGEFVLLLNPDTVVPSGTLAACVAALRVRPGTGMLGCKLLRPDGSLDHACKREIPSPAEALSYFARRVLWPQSVRTSRYAAGHLAHDEEGYVGAINGAFMLVRRQAIEDVGLFDESYWMYGEDLDWCRRFAEHGWRIAYWPTASVIHVKAGVTGARRSARVNFAFHQSMWLFYRKHHAGRYPVALTAAVWAAIWTKLAASITLNFFAGLSGGRILVDVRRRVLPDRVRVQAGAPERANQIGPV